jgi:hypothetical protein
MLIGLRCCLLHAKAATFAGRGSVELADAVYSDLVLSIHSCAQVRLTRSLPIKAGVGKIAELDRAHHPV